MTQTTSHMFITGPDAGLKTVTGEDVDFESLGGADTHHAKSGVVDAKACIDEYETLSFIKKLISIYSSK